MGIKFKGEAKKVKGMPFWDVYKKIYQNLCKNIVSYCKNESIAAIKDIYEAIKVIMFTMLLLFIFTISPFFVFVITFFAKIIDGVTVDINK